MREAVKLTPLTPEEQTFAEENYEALVKAMRTHHLSNDMYDVAAMGFLHAVKKWFARPDLRQWSFQTIVNKTVWSKLSGEREREKRRIQTVSLDEVIPGTDGLTYGTIITDANTSYLRREESKTMKINFDVKIPEAAGGRSPRNVHIFCTPLRIYKYRIRKTGSQCRFSNPFRPVNHRFLCTGDFPSDNLH